MRNRDIIAASVVLGFSFVSIMVVVARFLWVHHRPGKDHKDEENEYSVERQSSFFFKGGALTKLFTPKEERGDWVPTLSAIIKAGDEGIYSSTLYDSLQGHPGGIPLETLHNAFANDLRARPASERSKYPSEITKFLSTTKKGLRRSQSVRTNRGDGHGHGRPELPPRLQRNSIDLAEMGLSPARSRKVAQVLVSAFTGSVVDGGQGPAQGLWAQDLQHALYSEGRTGIRITARELAALSVILGSPVEPSRVQEGEKTERHTAVGKGAYGLSISGAATDDGGYHVSLTRHKRSISQLPARGSGYSTLYAKHLASGSLPFSSDAKTNSILATTKTLDALKSGAQLQLQKATPQALAPTFLASLPHAKLPSFHNLVPATSSTPTSTPTLLHAIANLPFTGGFTPLASAPLIGTVQFVASGGLVPGRLLQRLEALVEKVHRHSPGLHLFGLLHEDKYAGLLLREREKLGKLATGSLKSADEPLADKVARMHRYITLLERLMCLVPNIEPHEVLTAVREELKKQMERSYEDAVAAYLNKDNESATTTTNHKRHSSPSRHVVRHSRHSKDSSISSSAPTPIPASPGSRMSATSPRDSSTFPLTNLGRHIEGVLKTSLPLDIPTIALVARMVIVAWTLSVGTVAWEEGEEGFRVPDVDAMPEKMFMW